MKCIRAKACTCGCRGGEKRSASILSRLRTLRCSPCLAGVVVGQEVANESLSDRYCFETLYFNAVDRYTSGGIGRSHATAPEERLVKRQI